MATIEKRQDVEAQIVVRALKDDSYKQQLLNNPDFAKSEIETLVGQKSKDGFKVQVLQETADTAYILLPYVPPTQSLSENDLDNIATGTVSIGGTLQVPCMFGSATFTSGISIQAGV